VPSSDRREPDRRERKKPYQPPRLLVYGDMRTLTQLSGGTTGGMDMVDMSAKTGF
jgi:hypothetical protein